MDEIDREIIGALAADGRITVTDLARRIRLSASATSDRLRHLRTTGVISGFTVVIDPAAMGRSIEAIVDVRLAPGSPQRLLDEMLPSFPEIVDATHLTGRFDVQLRVATRDVGELDRLLVKLKEQFGAEETNTRLILRTIAGFPRAPL